MPGFAFSSEQADAPATSARRPSLPGCHIPVINNLQTLDRETRALGLAKDVQEGVLFM